jgi:hypothetical protein
MMKEVIRSELRIWATEYLSKNNIRYAGMPACPFAKKAMESDAVDVRMDFGWQYENVLMTARRFPEETSVVIHCEMNPSIDREPFHSDLQKLNNSLSKQNIWLIGFHPDDPDDDMEEDVDVYDGFVEEPYAMIFVQRLTELDDASRLLEAQRYYRNYTSAEIADLFKRRQAREEYDYGYGKKRKGTRSREQKEGTLTSDAGESKASHTEAS